MADEDLLEQISQLLNNPPRITADSTCVSSYIYSQPDQTLTIEFQARGTYRYSDVPLDEYSGFDGATSKGTYFNLYIRDRYSYERIG